MSVYFERHGSGPPLVLLHGLGGTISIWNPVLERLAAERDVIAVDMPGFGRSPTLPAATPPTAANLGAPITELCLSLGIERPHLAGNSLGAWAALEMAKAGAAASVCAISPAGLWRRPLGPRRADSRRLARRARPLLPLILASRRARIALLQTTMAHPERLSAAEARTLIGEWLRSPAYDAANHEMRSRILERPELVEVPVTVAWGERDRLVARPRPERLPPGARFLTFPDWGHTPTWDDPEGVAELILGASSGSPGPRGGHTIVPQATRERLR